MLADSASTAGDAKRGAQVFDDECSDCHTAAGKNGKEPALFGLVGCSAGTVPGYDYSDANKASHFVWIPEQLKVIC